MDLDGGNVSDGVHNSQPNQSSENQDSLPEDLEDIGPADPHDQEDIEDSGEPCLCR